MDNQEYTVYDTNPRTVKSSAVACINSWDLSLNLCDKSDICAVGKKWRVFKIKYFVW
jgi:phage terminase large subunit-like protein